MDDREEKIRVKAYEIWERQGRTGDPEDHWHEAERELMAGETRGEAAGDRSEATAGEAAPAQAVDAFEASDSHAANEGSVQSP